MPDQKQAVGRVLPRPTVVPYIAAWSSELGILAAELTMRPDRRGLCYRQETADDRDTRGVLWARVADSHGTGRPVYKDVHPHRQRACMTDSRCQVCAEPASVTKRGTLFLMTREPDEETPAGWPDGSLTVQPPLCLPCARLAVEQCPSLAGRHVAVRARKVRPYGVTGVLYVPLPDGTIRPFDDGSGASWAVPYTRRDIRWVLASQMAVELRRCTLVDLTDE